MELELPQFQAAIEMQKPVGQRNLFYYGSLCKKWACAKYFV